MKKLNRKGYITVEILLASIISAVIAVFLIELTVKLVSKTDDAYVDTLLTTDKALIIKNIKENIENDINNYGVINQITCETNKCTIQFKNNSKIIKTETKDIKYCSGSNNCTYEKKLNNALSNIEISNKSKSISEGKYIFIQIKAENIFAENNYIINIPILNNKTDEIVEENKSYKVTINIKGTYETFGRVISGGTYTATNVEVQDASSASISCDNGTGTMTATNSYTVTVTVANVTSDTTCNITY